MAIFFSFELLGKVLSYFMDIGGCKLGCRGRGGCPQIGNQVADGDIDFVAYTTDNR